MNDDITSERLADLLKVAECGDIEGWRLDFITALRELERLRVELDTVRANLYRTIESKQAKIDALMMEFCPGEMSAEQRAEWARNQQPASPEQRAAIDSAIDSAMGDANG